MSKHVADECPDRQVACPQGCGLEVQYKLLQEHIADGCKQTKVECALGCGIETLTVGAVKAHLANECPNRLVLCRRGCTEYGRDSILEAKNRQQHEEQECTETVVTCDLNCGTTMYRRELPE
jgi:hypothetical protein